MKKLDCVDRHPYGSKTCVSLFQTISKPNLYVVLQDIKLSLIYWRISKRS